MARDERRSSGSGDPAKKEDDGLFSGFADRYIYADDVPANIAEDLSSFWESLTSFSWLGIGSSSDGGASTADTGSALDVSLPAVLIAIALTVAAPRILAVIWRRTRASLFNKPGTLLCGYMDREGNFLKRWWLPAKAIWQTVSDQLRITLIVGTIGIGKTTLMSWRIRQHVKAGIPVVVIEMSGNLAGRARAHAARYGKPYYSFDPEIAKAMGFNPVAGPDKEKVAGRLVDTICGDYATREQYFKQMNEVMLRPTVIAVKSYEEDYLHGEANLEHIREFIVNQSYRQKVLQLNEKSSPDAKSKELKVSAPWIDEYTKNFFEKTFYGYWSGEQREKHLTGLANSLNILTAAEAFRNALCPAEGHPRIDLAQAIKEPGAVITFRAPIEVDSNDSACALAGLILGRFEQITESRELPEMNPVALYLDEAHEILSQRNFHVAQRFKSWLPMVRHNYVITAIGYQSFSMLEYGLQQIIMTLARNKFVYGASLGPDDRHEAERIGGYHEEQVTERRRSRKRFIPIPIISSLDQTDMVGTRTEVKPVYPSYELAKMGPGEAVTVLTLNNHETPSFKIKIPKDTRLSRWYAAQTARIRRWCRLKANRLHLSAVAAIQAARADRALATHNTGTDERTEEANT